MEIKIETKYNLGDIVIGYRNGIGFKKYKIKDIQYIKQSVMYDGYDEPEYLCELATETNTKCSERFKESELFAADELRDYLNKFLTYPTTSAEAKRDIEIYSEIKDLIRYRTPVTHLSDNVRWIECIKWLENKFPELEQIRKQGVKL